MSAYVMDKSDIDALVTAADRYGRHGYQGASMQWWQVDADGEFAGWRHLDHHGFHGGDDEWFSLSQLGQMLVSANVLGVAYRYSEPGRVPYYGEEAAQSMSDESDTNDAAAILRDDLPGPTDRYYQAPYVYARSPFTEPPTPGKVFELLDRFDYQSCEHPSWRKSEAFAFCEALRVKVCRVVSDSERGEQ